MSTWDSGVRVLTALSYESTDRQNILWCIKLCVRKPPDERRTWWSNGSSFRWKVLRLKNISCLLAICVSLEVSPSKSNQRKMCRQNFRIASSSPKSPLILSHEPPVPITSKSHRSTDVNPRVRLPIIQFNGPGALLIQQGSSHPPSRADAFL